MAGKLKYVGRIKEHLYAYSTIRGASRKLTNKSIKKKRAKRKNRKK
ncbi:MAG: hypothetical protein K2P17_04000 [Helicobacteraceae bacterium]|nr:hypothetical protein [Helicobacteraceae bacterium]